MKSDIYHLYILRLDQNFYFYYLYNNILKLIRKNE